MKAKLKVKIDYPGTSKLDWAVMFTVIQKELRKINPNITISFDSASPTTSSAKWFSLLANYTKCR